MPHGRKFILFFSVGNEIRQYLPSSKKLEYTDVLMAGHRIEALDYDPNRKLLYWTDSAERNIKRAMMPDDATQAAHAQTLPASGIMQPNGIAFDWVARYADLMPEGHQVHMSPSQSAVLDGRMGA